MQSRSWLLYKIMSINLIVLTILVKLLEYYYSCIVLCILVSNVIYLNDKVMEQYCILRSKVWKRFGSSKQFPGKEKGWHNVKTLGDGGLRFLWQMCYIWAFIRGWTVSFLDTFHSDILYRNFKLFLILLLWTVRNNSFKSIIAFLRKRVVVNVSYIYIYSYNLLRQDSKLSLKFGFCIKNVSRIIEVDSNFINMRSLKKLQFTKVWFTFFKLLMLFSSYKLEAVNHLLILFWS